SGNSTAPINFSFGNLGTTAGSSLQVLATSSNQALVPDANLTVSTSGTNGAITVATVAGQTGSAVITVSTTDGLWSNSQTFNVIVPDFTVASSAPQTANAGDSAAYTVDVGSLGGFSDAVALSATGLPPGATATFTPASVTGAGSSALSINTSTSTPAGTYNITIAGTSGNLTRSTTVTLDVMDFAVSAIPSSQAVIVGNSISYTASVVASNGFSGTVAWTISGLPAGAAADFSPANVNGSGDSVLSVSTALNTPSGIYPLTLTGTSGGLSHSTSVTLVVSDFSVIATPSSQTVTVGNSATYTANAVATNGFGGTVTWTVSGLPNGATADFSPASVTGSGSSTLTVATSGTTPSGSYTLTVTGTSGGVVHSKTVTLVVTDFSVTATPAAQSVIAGNNTTYTVNVGALNGFNNVVDLSVSGLPAGATAGVSPAS